MRGPDGDAVLCALAEEGRLHDAPFEDSAGVGSGALSDPAGADPDGGRATGDG